MSAAARPATAVRLPIGEKSRRPDSQANQLRRTIYGGSKGGIDDLTCAFWTTDPSTLNLGGHMPGVERRLAGIRAGGEMWLPTYSEAHAASVAADAATRAAEASAAGALRSNAPAPRKSTRIVAVTP